MTMQYPDRIYASTSLPYPDRVGDPQSDGWLYRFGQSYGTQS